MSLSSADMQGSLLSVSCLLLEHSTLSSLSLSIHIHARAMRILRVGQSMVCVPFKVSSLHVVSYLLTTVCTWPTRGVQKLIIGYHEGFPFTHPSCIKHWLLTHLFALVFRTRFLYAAQSQRLFASVCMRSQISIRMPLIE